VRERKRQHEKVREGFEKVRESVRMH